MSTNTVRISPEAALRETMELAEFYRNRNLILAEQLAAASRELEVVRAELEAVKRDGPAEIVELEKVQ